MNKCTYCSRESDSHNFKIVEGYHILECCTDCEDEIKEGWIVDKKESSASTKDSKTINQIRIKNGLQPIPNGDIPLKEMD